MDRQNDEKDGAARQALIAQRLRARSHGGQAAGQIPRRAEGGPAPLSAAQRRLWILQQIEPDSPIPNRPMALRLTGRLDRDALTLSLGEIVRRHEALRTVF